MPYITLESNRYIGEHDCGHYHYGDMSMVRNCCVEDCRKRAENVRRVAMTTSHPAYALYRDSWNSLTDAEMTLVPDLYNDYHKGWIDRHEVTT